MAALTELPLLRTSERGQFKRCHQRWYWGTVEGWGPKGPPDIKLWFGTGWHALMAYWYGDGKTRGKEPLKFWRDWIGEETAKIRVNLTSNDEYKEEFYIEARELGEVMWEHYFETYGRDEHMWFIQTEHVGQVTVTHPTTKKPMLNYAFTYDGVYIDERDDKVWLIEHKTAKAIMLNHLPLDDQAGSYWAVATTELRAANLIGKNQSLSGIMYNFARKSPPDNRPVNERGVTCNKATKNDYLAALASELEGLTNAEVRSLKVEQLEDLAGEAGIKVFGEESKNQPTPTLIRHPVYRTRAERNSQIQKIQNEFIVMEQFRSGNLPLTKNPTKDCSWDCPFYEPCILDERAADYMEYMTATMKVGDPYEPYRKTASVAGDM